MINQSDRAGDVHKAAPALSVDKEKKDETFLYSRISNRRTPG